MARRNKKCPDCEKMILEYSNKCGSCAQKGGVAWNKGIPNTWYNPIGLEAGWEAKKELLKNRIRKICAKEGCNNQFSVPQCLDRVRYCSRSCKAKALTPTGENHWNWKGGTTSQDRMDRVRFRKTIQKLVFERDNYTCQICGNRGDLQADHIQEWSDYVELRFDMNNCRTLCARCHYKITFGREMPINLKGWGHNLLKGGDNHFSNN